MPDDLARRRHHGSRRARAPGRLAARAGLVDEQRHPTPDLDAELAVLDAAVARCTAEHRLADLAARVDNAQLLANMGDYDWEIATDTNTWSDQLYRIYGYEPQSFNAGYDRFLAHIHPDDRERITGIHQQAYASGEPYQMIERIVRPDGETRYLLVQRPGRAGRERRAGAHARHLHRHHRPRARPSRSGRSSPRTMAEARVRRRQALEIDDNVVQGLTAAIFATELGETERADYYLRQTLEAARSMMNDWLRPLEGDDTGEVRPGDLVRSSASTLHPGGPPHSQLRASTPAHPNGPRVRVLVADDYEDMRQLLSLQLEGSDRYEVVGEAADGAEAVELARTLQPDVVVLDLAMPTMDGLQALPLIREAVEGVHVVALSGFHEPAMIDKVLAAGAARYLQKGAAMDLPAVLDEVLAVA